jgi:serine/threonine protein kinase
VPTCRNTCGVLVTPALVGDFTVLEKLGSGAFGDVYRAEDKITGQDVALKVIKRRGAQPGELDLVRVEVDAMKRVMGDPHCVRIEAAFQDRHHLYLALVSDHTSCGWFV